MGLKSAVIFFLCLTPITASALNARLLLDENSLIKMLRGRMDVSPIKDQLAVRGLASETKTLDPGDWRFVVTSDGLSINRKKDGSFFRLRGGAFSITGEFSMGGQRLSELRVFRKRKGANWVAYLPVDQYLYGVMAAEVPASWPQEVLKAQAIASRTYFLFKKLERSDQEFDVRATTLDQVFSAKESRFHSIIQAVNQTHGLILVSRDKEEVFPAYFHSDCGGGTSSEKMVWGKAEASNQAIHDPYCKTATKNNWSYELDQDHLMVTLRELFYLPKGITLDYILPRKATGDRSYVVDFLFSKKIIKRLSANELRRALGFSKLKSTRFKVDRRDKGYVFTGQGYGHGVGLCQWGAQRWARKGKNYQFILKHYYPAAKIRRMDADQFDALQAQLDY